MTLEEIQSDESRRLAEFPVAEKTIYLAHAAVCPLPAGSGHTAAWAR